MLCTAHHASWEGRSLISPLKTHPFQSDPFFTCSCRFKSLLLQHVSYWQSLLPWYTILEFISTNIQRYICYCQYAIWATVSVKMKTTIIFTYCHAMLCQYQKLLQIHAVCDLHQIYIFLNGSLCVICKYPVNFIHINEAAFALYWHFYANYSNSLCAMLLYVTQARAFKARLLFPWMSSIGQVQRLPFTVT